MKLKNAITIVASVNCLVGSIANANSALEKSPFSSLESVVKGIDANDLLECHNDGHSDTHNDNHVDRS